MVTLVKPHTLAPVTFGAYLVAMSAARSESPIVADMTSEPTDADGTRYLLSADQRSGFAIRADGELVLVFSTARGRGAHLVDAAIAAGARRLDCFDGYLVDLYGRHGFKVARREANWTPGGPDVVFMALDLH